MIQRWLRVGENQLEITLSAEKSIPNGFTRKPRSTSAAYTS